MPNPTSTTSSTKQLVGLGLRGIRNSPPTTQIPGIPVPVQLKSAVSKSRCSSPRTSPTTATNSHGRTTLSPTIHVNNNAFTMVDNNFGMVMMGTVKSGGTDARTRLSPSSSSSPSPIRTLETDPFMVIHHHHHHHPSVGTKLGDMVSSIRGSQKAGFSGTPVVIGLEGCGGGRSGNSQKHDALTTALGVHTSTTTTGETGKKTPPTFGLGLRVPGVGLIRAGSGLGTGAGTGGDTDTNGGGESTEDNQVDPDQWRFCDDSVKASVHNTEQGSLHSQSSPPIPPLSPPPPVISASSTTHATQSSFVDVPFPLHPEKTFRIHTSPLAGSPLLHFIPVMGPVQFNTTPNINTGQPGVDGNGVVHCSVHPDVAILPKPTLSKRQSLLPSSVSCPFPSTTSSSNTDVGSPPRTLLKSALSSKDLVSVRSVAAITTTTNTQQQQRGPRSIKFEDDLPLLSPTPEERMRMSRPINEDMYNSPTSPPRQGLSPILLPSSPSPSSFSTPSVPLREESRVLLSARHGGVEMNEEENYSTVCSPSSTPFLVSNRMNSSSPSPSSRSSRKSVYCGSPVAKIETVLGPRERGIECVPEKRDYQFSYSSLKQSLDMMSRSPGSLTPVDEDKTLDLDVGSQTTTTAAGGSNARVMRLNLDTGIDGLGFGSGEAHTSEDASGGESGRILLSGLPITSGPGGGSSGFVFGTPSCSGPAPGDGARAVVSTRVGLRRRATGVSSPLANCVATWESIASDGEREGEEEENLGEEEEMPTSPLLMRVKDSLLLKDVKKRRRRTITESTTTAPESLAGTGSRWDTLSSDKPDLLSDTEAETCSLLADFQLLSPLTMATQIGLPDTPTIGPSTRTASGSKELEEVISPLQLSSPTLPLPAILMDSAWVSPLSTPVTIGSGRMCGTGIA